MNPERKSPIFIPSSSVAVSQVLQACLSVVAVPCNGAILFIRSRAARYNDGKDRLFTESFAATNIRQRESHETIIMRQLFAISTCLLLATHVAAGLLPEKIALFRAGWVSATAPLAQSDRALVLRSRRRRLLSLGCPFKLSPSAERSLNVLKCSLA